MLQPLPVDALDTGWDASQLSGRALVGLQIGLLGEVEKGE
jgi:hypothetical protein